VSGIEAHGFWVSSLASLAIILLFFLVRLTFPRGLRHLSIVFRLILARLPDQRCQLGGFLRHNTLTSSIRRGLELAFLGGEEDNMSDSIEGRDATWDQDLTLNEVAVRLATIPEIQCSKNIAVEPLLSLLSHDVLQAVAWYPSKLTPRIKIPGAYWRSINAPRFRQIIYQHNKRARKGTYLTSVEELFDYYLDAVFAAIHENPQTDNRNELLRADIRHVVKCFGDSQEVLVPTSAWTELLVARGWAEEQEAESSGRGRPEKAWSDLFPYIVAEIVPEGNLKEKSKELAGAILKAAKGDKIGNLPRESTLNERINALYTKVKWLQKKES
jgi:hypothetical protein